MSCLSFNHLYVHIEGTAAHSIQTNAMQYFLTFNVTQSSNTLYQYFGKDLSLLLFFLCMLPSSWKILCHQRPPVRPSSTERNQENPAAARGGGARGGGGGGSGSGGIHAGGEERKGSSVKAFPRRSEFPVPSGGGESIATEQKLR